MVFWETISETYDWRSNPEDWDSGYPEIASAFIWNSDTGIVDISGNQDDLPGGTNRMLGRCGILASQD